MTSQMTNITRTNINLLDPNLAINQTADPALNKTVFDEIYNYFDTFVTAYNAFIANGGIATANLSDLSVTTAKLALLAVTASQIADGTITTGKIATGGVTSANILDGTIVTGDLADASVSTDKLIDLAVTTAKIGLQSIGTAQIADGAVTSAKILDGAISTADLADAIITTAKLIDLSITSGKLAIGSVGPSQLDPALLLNYGDIAVQAALNKMRFDVTAAPYYAKGDGVTDDTIAINSAAAAANSAGGGTIFFPKGNYVAVALSLIIPANVFLFGDSGLANFKFGGSLVPIPGYATTSMAHSNTYNIENGLERWRAKLAKVRSGVANQKAKISYIGDSIGEGAWAGGGSVDGVRTDWPIKGNMRRMQNVLNSKYGDVGLGLIPSYYPTGASLWGYVGTWTDLTGVGVAGMSKQTTVNGDTATLAFNGTGVGIVYTKDPTAGTFTYSIDGAAAVSVNAFNASSLYGITLEVTGLAQGDHTLVLTNTSSNKLLLTGAYAIKGTSGIVMNMCSRSSSVTADHSASSSLDVEINAMSPDLTIISLTANDFGNQVPVATYRANLQTIITRALTYGDVMLVSSGLYNTTRTIPQTEYLKAMKDIALLNNVAFLDLATRWGGTGVYADTTLGLLADGLHPNDYGQQDMANFMLSVITSSESQTQENNTGNGTPIGIVTPITIGETYTDLTTGIVYVSNGTTNTSWSIPTQYNGMSFQAIVDGNFDAPWQRGTSFTNPASSAFTADHWKVASNIVTGAFPSNIVHTRQVLTPGDIPNSYYYYRINVDGAGTSPIRYQMQNIIENGTRYLAGNGKKEQLTFYARSSIANKRLGIAMFQGYGSGGSPSGTENLIGNNFTLTSTWAKYTVTFTTNTLVGKTFGSNNDDALTLIIGQAWDPVTQFLYATTTSENFVGTGNIDIAQVKLNGNDINLPYMPESPDEVAKKVLRYAWIPQTNSVFVRMTSYTANTLIFNVPLPVQMRATPTIRGTINTDMIVNSMASVAQTGFTAAATLTSNGVIVTLTKTAHGLTDGYLEIKTTSGFEAEL